MRTIDRAIPLIHDHLSFVWTIYIFGTKHQLPTRRNTTSRSKYIVVPISLIKLRTFHCRVGFMTVKYYFSFIGNFSTFSVHFLDSQHTFNSCTTTCPTMNQIYLSVSIPKRTRVYETFAFFYQNRLRPRTSRVFSFGQINPKIWVRIINPKFTSMIANRRSPNAIAMLSF